MTLADLYLERCRTPSDINEHLPVLSSFASGCQHATEFGIREGNSTIALLNGLAGTGYPRAHLESYDISPPKFECPVLPEWVTWGHQLADTSKLPKIDPTDLLFIDTLHTAEQVEAELRHAWSVRLWIIFHDTMLYGSIGEFNHCGIIEPIFQFLINHPSSWQITEHYPNNNGLLVLRWIQ
jgi:Methyltransferase domain